MGALDQFAKATFAADTEEITGGAIVWEGPQEVGLTEVRLDGLLSVKAPGCYALGHEASATWWIAANELPLHESLIPLLIARSGAALLEFTRWVIKRRAPEWTLEMLRCVAMSQPSMRELMKMRIRRRRRRSSSSGTGRSRTGC